MLERKFHT